MDFLVELFLFIGPLARRMGNRLYHLRVRLKNLLGIEGTQKLSFSSSTKTATLFIDDENFSATLALREG